MWRRGEGRHGREGLYRNKGLTPRQNQSSKSSAHAPKFEKKPPALSKIGAGAFHGKAPSSTKTLTIAPLSTTSIAFDSMPYLPVLEPEVLAASLRCQSGAQKYFANEGPSPPMKFTFFSG